MTEKYCIHKQLVKLNKVWQISLKFHNFTTKFLSFIVCDVYSMLKWQCRHDCVCDIFSSAGVGRSGTYITLDTMLQCMAVTQDVNVYEFVHNMRMKQVFMVQTQVL